MLIDDVVCESNFLERLSPCNNDLSRPKDTGGDFVLVPATDVDMRGKNAKPKKSLEVMYDEA